MKRDFEDDNQDNDQQQVDDGCNDQGNAQFKRSRGGQEEIRLLIPSKMAGSIIGKGGANIKKLRADNHAQVNVRDCTGPERVLVINADIESAIKVVHEVLKIQDKASENESELRILVHQSLAGCIIGRAGAKIKELKEQLGCRLKVFSNVAPQSSDRVAQVVGNEEQCLRALNEIISLIKDTPIKGGVQNYDPQNYDDQGADQYGGYGSGGGNSGGPGNFRNSGGGFGRDRFGGGGRGGNDRRSGGGVNPWASGMNDNQFGGGNFGGGGNNMGMGGMNPQGNNMGNMNPMNNMGGGFNNDNTKSSTQVTIPKDMAGAIIGKAGGRIRRIRDESNAHIQIDEALPGSNDRVITITGTQSEIQAAQYMLQQSVRDNLASGGGFNRN